MLTKHQLKVYQAQDRILKFLKKRKRFPFVLSGGTALSRFYLHHRFSEDLDFFFEGFEFSFEKIDSHILALQQSGIRCEFLGKTDVPDRFKFCAYLIGDTLPIKTDFLEDPLSGMWNPLEKKSDSGLSFRIDHKDQIYYRKFYAVLEQWYKHQTIRRIKDIVDLYILHTQYRSIEDTIDYYLKEHVPIDVEKLMLIFDSFNPEILEEALNEMGVSVKSKKLISTFKKCSDNLLKKGLKK